MKHLRPCSHREAYCLSWDTGVAIALPPAERDPYYLLATQANGIMRFGSFREMLIAAEEIANNQFMEISHAVS